MVASILTPSLASRPPPSLPPSFWIQLDIGSLDRTVVEDAIRVAGGNRAGVMSLTKAVRAAAACISV